MPADSAISVENLSAAGEQYIDFKPKLIAPPYFSDGTVIPADRVGQLVTGADLLKKGNALMSALNIDQVHTIIDNMPPRRSPAMTRPSIPWPPPPG